MTKTIKSNNRGKTVTRSVVRSMIKGQRLANAELKGLLNANTILTPGTAGTVYNITQPIVQGDTFQQRDGNQLNLLSMECIFHGTAVGVSNAMRFIVIQDHMCNGSPPTTTDVLDFASWIAGYNITTVTQERRFGILFDKTMDLNINGENAKTARVKLSRFQHKLTYLATTNVTAANGRNSIFLLAISNSSAGIIDWSFKLNFLDQ